MSCKDCKWLVNLWESTDGVWTGKCGWPVDVVLPAHHVVIPPIFVLGKDGVDCETFEAS